MTDTAIGDRESAEPFLSLGPARDEPQRWDALIAWNEAGNWPQRDGLSRSLPGPVALRFVREQTDEIRSIRIVGAIGIRAQLVGGPIMVRGNLDTRWEQLDAHQPTWSQSHRGDELWIRAKAPLELQILELVELTAEELSSTPASSIRSKLSGCVVDANCVSADPDLDLARHAIGRMRFQSGSYSYTCSGGLVADTLGSDVPYFLTAEHCISTPDEARSLEVMWDYSTLGCQASSASAWPGRTAGAELLLARRDLDLSLLRLNSIPEFRAFLGWTTETVTDQVIRRVSHPSGGPQVYSETIAASSISGCEDAPTRDYLYQDPWFGAIGGGSSGAPSWIAGARLVGQLSGTCGRGDCNVTTDQVDGRFSRSMRFVQPWLAPAAGVSAPGDLRVTLRGRRRVELAWVHTSPSETYYELWRSGGQGNDVLVATLTPDSTSAAVTSLKSRRTYRFRVMACNENGCSVPAETWARTLGRAR